MKVQLKVSNDILFFAFRYALGRRSMAVTTVVQEIMNHWSKLPETDKVMYKDEIRKAIQGDNAGDQCDITEWQKIMAL